MRSQRRRRRAEHGGGCRVCGCRRERRRRQERSSELRLREAGGRRWTLEAVRVVIHVGEPIALAATPARDRRRQPRSDADCHAVGALAHLLRWLPRGFGRCIRWHGDSRPKWRLVILVLVAAAQRTSCGQRPVRRLRHESRSVVTRYSARRLHRVIIISGFVTLTDLDAEKRVSVRVSVRPFSRRCSINSKLELETT